MSALEHTAAAYRSAKDYEKATQYYQQALKAAKEAKLREYEWLVLSDLGSMYGEMGNIRGGCALPTSAHPRPSTGRQGSRKADTRRVGPVRQTVG